MTTNRTENSSAKVYLMAAAVLVFLLVFVFVGTAVVFKIMDLSNSPYAPQSGKFEKSSDVPDVQLQPYPKRDRLELEKRAYESMTEYTWTDREKGLVQVPVERAMELALEKGFTVHKEAS